MRLRSASRHQLRPRPTGLHVTGLALLVAAVLGAAQLALLMRWLVA